MVELYPSMTQKGRSSPLFLLGQPEQSFTQLRSFSSSKNQSMVLIKWLTVFLSIEEEL